MYRAHSIAVVVPAYNEEGLVGGVVRALPAFVDWIYAVDDSSTDRTVSEIRRVAAEAADERPPTGRTPPVLAARLRDEERIGRTVLLRHRRNFGAGGAIKTGYLAALRDGADLVATIDGDGQMDPRMLSRFLDPIVDGDAEYVKGTRLLSSEARRGMSHFRLLGNAVLTGLTRLASGYWQVTDSQNGYTAISREALLRVDAAGLYEYYGYLNDLLTKLGVERMRVVEVPHPCRYANETSHIVYHHYIPKVSWLLFLDFCWRLRVQFEERATQSVVVSYAGSIALGLVGCLLVAATLLSGPVVEAGGYWWFEVVATLFATSLALFGLAVRLDVSSTRGWQRNEPPVTPERPPSADPGGESR
jgi:glycosyltransferase involved in cell wall biosynthesis